MKENSKVLKKSVCREDDLMCIFKGVPDFVGDEEEPMGGSHHEVVMGRAGITHSSSFLSTVTDRRRDKKKKKEKANLPIDESELEFEIWSSPYTSKDQLTSPVKKQQKKTPKKKKSMKWKMDEQTMCRFAEQLVGDVSSGDPSSDERLYEKYPDIEVLCEDCRWLVHATQSVARHADDQEENDEELEKLMGMLNPEDSTQVNYAKNYKKAEVLKALDEIHSSLLECSILLTVSRLRTKIRRESEEGGKGESGSETSLKAVEEALDGGDPSEMELLIDEIKEEEDVKEGQSKLCLTLGKLVSKYLRVK